ncbi:MAG: NAD kinase [Saprospiraceae bacterium]|jgi:NAD+ kinase
MKVIVYARKLNDSILKYLNILVDSLTEIQSEVFLSKEIYHQLRNDDDLFTKVNLLTGKESITLDNFDFFITLGGDGTILGALTYVKGSGIPIMGINVGRLGFLASIEKKKIREAVNAIKEGFYTKESRTLLNISSNYPIFANLPLALNDVTVSKRDTSSMVTIHTYIDGEYLNSYWGDGLIISTPTGSTGYSLSCGGPIVFPGSGNFVITPIAPHNLNIRPIVVSDKSEILLKIEGRTENFLCTLDARFETITTAHQLKIRKYHYPLFLVRMKDASFSKTIRSKLAWGVDKRNK